MRRKGQKQARGRPEAGMHEEESAGKSPNHWRTWPAEKSRFAKREEIMIFICNPPFSEGLQKYYF